MKATVVRHHNHNQFRLTLWADDNDLPAPPQVDNNVRSIQWTVTEVIHNNKNGFLSTKLNYSIKIWAVSDGFYHTTYQYRTSTWIIKTQNNNHTITGDNFVPGDAKYQYYHRSELCRLLGYIQHINNICST